MTTRPRLLALLKLNSVVGVTGFFDAKGNLKSMGIQCAFCHSNVDDSLVPGIGHRLDGWANRDLNVGAIVSLARNLQPVADLLGVDVPTVKKSSAAGDQVRREVLVASYNQVDAYPQKVADIFPCPVAPIRLVCVIGDVDKQGRNFADGICPRE